MKRLSAAFQLLVLAGGIGIPHMASFAASAMRKAGTVDLPVVAPVVDCGALSDVDLSTIGGAGSAVTSAEMATSDGIAVCRVKGTLAPKINFEVLLPTQTWTQRYLQVGCGGLCGNVTLMSGASTGCQVFANGGFVMAATDMGHASQGMTDDASWGRDRQLRIDFAYRAQHLTSLASKALIKAFYGQAQKYAYFNGCSDGGREALMEAERFPDDFDGVIAGAPAMLFQVQNTLYHGWQSVSNTDAEGKVILLADRLPILHDAVLEACDANDGVKDGLISQPALCHFEPRTIICPKDAKDTSQCLAAAEAEVARKFYEGPRDPETGAYLTAGQPLYGSELDWEGVYVASKATGSIMSTNAALPVIRNIAFEPSRPDATLATFPFTTQTLDDLRARHHLFDATSPDLSGFEKAGGKLILWHGLADPHISPANTLSLHDGMIRTMGKDVVKSFERLYFLPGVAHCGNGQGPSNLDLLTSMMDWVENGDAPDAIMTTSTRRASNFGAPNFDGSNAMSAEKNRSGAPPMPQSKLPDMTRPVYPYPFVAKYKGKGSIYDGANWQKGAAAQVVALHEWPGENLFMPYPLQDR